MNVYTFWEGPMPSYIKLCLNTWHFPFEIINYDTLKQYTDFDIDRAKRFTLPQIADCVRVHVLRDNGGYWLDTDTICIADKLPKENIMGYPDTRAHTIGMLHTESHADMYEKWAAFQDEIISRDETPKHWATMGNAFTDAYISSHPEIRIGDIYTRWPETYMIPGDAGRYEKYIELYFNSENDLEDLEPTDILMLHNSWIPDWYKQLSKDSVLNNNCTLSNILRKLICNT